MQGSVVSSGACRRAGWPRRACGPRSEDDPSGPHGRAVQVYGLLPHRLVGPEVVSPNSNPNPNPNPKTLTLTTLTLTSCNQLGLVGFREKYHVEGHQMPTFSSVYAIPTFSFKLNATLTSLNLGWNGLGPKGTAQLAAGLKGNTTLTSLILDGNCLCGVYKEFNNKTQFLEEMGTYSAAAFTELCEALKYSAVTSLRCVAAARARLSASAPKHTGAPSAITTCAPSFLSQPLPQRHLR